MPDESISFLIFYRTNFPLKKEYFIHLKRKIIYEQDQEIENEIWSSTMIREDKLLFEKFSK